MEPWCWLSSKLSCHSWVMKFPRRIALSFWMNWQAERMRMDSSPTVPSWTNCVASKQQTSPRKKNNWMTIFIEEQHFKQLKTCSALQYSNGKSYFFKNGRYYRFDDKNFILDASANPPFPRETGFWWFGCPANSVRLTKLDDDVSWAEAAMLE